RRLLPGNPLRSRVRNSEVWYYGFDTNDMKYFHPNGFVRPLDLSDYVDAALDVLVAEAGQSHSSMMSIGLHLRICGRPARLHAVRVIVAQLVDRRRDSAAHFCNECPSP